MSVNRRVLSNNISLSFQRWQTRTQSVGNHPFQIICKTCQRKISTPTSRWTRQFSASAIRSAVKSSKEQQYPSRLLIYDAGDARTTWISFWKAVALLQFGTTLVFAVPPLWQNENQPDPRMRKLQAILVGVLGTIPTLTLAYVTAPFVHQVFLQIPEYARRSRHDLLHFARSLNTNIGGTANARMEFVTLRIFPIRKHTTALLHELRALPAKRMRLANIEIPKDDAWAKRQRAKGIFRRIVEVIQEPRFKFYVKEGRTYTMKTGVPGVWEEVASRIRFQSTVEGIPTSKIPASTSSAKLDRKASPPAAVAQRSIKRQTARSARPTALRSQRP